MNWKQHVQKWQNCTECKLCQERAKIVLGKGSIPADVLFIGEAPGKSENAVGVPFYGEAGNLLQDLIIAGDLWDYKLFYSNLVCCLPRYEIEDKDGSTHWDLKDPEKGEIKKCSPRLLELYQLVKPKIVVAVGNVAYKFLPDIIGVSKADMFQIIHPGAVLRMDDSQKGLAIQNSVSTLRAVSNKLKSKRMFIQNKGKHA